MSDVIISARISVAMKHQLQILAAKLHKKESVLIREALLALIGTYTNATQTERK